MIDPYLRGDLVNLIVTQPKSSNTLSLGGETLGTETGPLGNDYVDLL